MLTTPETRLVAPTTGAWIETIVTVTDAAEMPVAPTTGAWIETRAPANDRVIATVAPTTGAWIETLRGRPGRGVGPVAPTTGAWIETGTSVTVGPDGTSPPPRGRGSKPLKKAAMAAIRCRPHHGGVDRNYSVAQHSVSVAVAPTTGAWIENRE